MTHYSYAQLEEIWIQAGGNRAMAPLMAAIAMVESGGNPDAENPSGATGLWQMEWPLYRGFVPGADSRAAYHNPLINARAAVKLSRNVNSVAPGSPVYSNWLQYEPANAYRQYLKGGVSPSGPVPAKGASTGSAQLTGFNVGDIADPFTAINDLMQTVAGVITSPVDLATSMTSIAKNFGSIVGVFGSILKDIEWLLVPSHWMRIAAFAGGVGFLIPGTWALMKTGTGQSGDVTLALGILLIVIAGILLFIAFHNLPDNVRSFPDLLGFITTSIQGQVPAALCQSRPMTCSASLPARPRWQQIRPTTRSGCSSRSPWPRGRRRSWRASGFSPRPAPGSFPTRSACSMWQASPSRIPKPRHGPARRRRDG